eukprot:15364330-Alexandrium_andersonii.AAC.1
MATANFSPPCSVGLPSHLSFPTCGYIPRGSKSAPSSGTALRRRPRPPSRTYIQKAAGHLPEAA